MSGSNQTAAKAKPPSFKTAALEGTIVVEIGPEHKKYYVHKPLLMHHSEYFAKALKGQWREAEDGVVPLEDVEPVTFEIFVTWLYSGKLPEEEKDWAEMFGACGDPDDCAAERVLASIKAYTFGDRFLAPDFRRFISNTIVDWMDGRPLPREELYPIVKLAFDVIPADRVILQFLVDEHCLDYDDDLDREAAVALEKQLPNTFLRRVMRRSFESRRSPRAPERCYYEHVDNVEKEQCAKEKSRVHMVYSEATDFGYFPS